MDQKKFHGHMPCYTEGSRLEDVEPCEAMEVIELDHSLVIEATDEPDFFGFYSPDLEGFTGIGHSIEDCLYKAKWGMKEHIALLKEKGLPVPPANSNPRSSFKISKNQWPSEARPGVGTAQGQAVQPRVRGGARLT